MKLKLRLMSPVGTCGGLWGEVGPSATPTATAASGTFTSAGPGAKVQRTHSTWKHILPCWARSELMFPLQEITHTSQQYLYKPRAVQCYMLQKCIIDSALSKELQLQDSHVTLQTWYNVRVSQLCNLGEQNNYCSHYVYFLIPFF